mgnify:CR=1 FL=1
MHTLGIVTGLNVLENIEAILFQVVTIFMVNKLSFCRVVKRFYNRIVIAITLTAHTLLNAFALEHPLILFLAGTACLVLDGRNRNG